MQQSDHVRCFGARLDIIISVDYSAYEREILGPWFNIRPQYADRQLALQHVQAGRSMLKKKLCCSWSPTCGLLLHALTWHQPWLLVTALHSYPLSPLETFYLRAKHCVLSWAGNDQAVMRMLSPI
jgi:hypothetical protein